MKGTNVLTLGLVIVVILALVIPPLVIELMFKAIEHKF